MFPYLPDDTANANKHCALARSETAIAEQEQRFRYIFDSVGVSIWEEDFSVLKAAIDELKAQGIKDFAEYFHSHPDFVEWAIGAIKILNVNDATVQLLSAQDKAQVLTSLHQIFLPETREVFIGELIAIAESKTFFEAEATVKTLQGKRLNVLFTITFPPAGYSFDCVLITWTDITDRVKLEAEREQARIQAEEANRIKDQFLAVLSHELRSPLNPILGWTNLLRSKKLNEIQTDQALETIERNAKLQAEIVKDLLDMSRILQGKLRLNVTSVNLANTILAAIQAVSLAASAKQIEIVTLFEDSSGQVQGDAARLQQVFWNLLSNAVKFTANGGRVEIILSQETVHTSPRYAQIKIIDTGKGISPSFLPHVFEYFRQADSSSTRQFGGLGLGLAIVRSIVELHGGTVTVESPGEELGTTFTVRLPLLPSSGKTLPLSEEPESNESISLNDVKVLVVDDNADSLDFVAFVLKTYNAQVTGVASVLEALQYLTHSKPDVLVCDIGMPEMDGYTLLHYIRSWTKEQGGKIPAIALTAFAEEYDQQQAFAAGFQAHLPKPVDPAKLATTVARVVGFSPKSKI